MIRSYAVQCDVRPITGAAADVPWQLRSHIARWMVDWYRRQNVAVTSLPIEGGGSAPIPGHEIRIASVTAEGAYRWVLDWRYPTPEDSGMDWETRCLLASVDGTTELGISRRILSREFRIAPITAEFRQPRLVRSILDAFSCHVGSRPLVTKPRPVSATETDAFVADLLDAGRRIPIIALTKDPFSGKTAVDADQLAETLVGLAEVAVLDDKWATFALSEEVGKWLSVYLGALRVYWPGFRRDVDPYAHPLFLPERLSELFPRGIVASLFEWLAEWSAVRHAPGEVAREADRRIDADRRNEIDRVRSAGKPDRDTDRVFDELTKQVESLQSENVRLHAQVADLERSLASRAVAGVGGGNEPSVDDVVTVEAAVSRAAESFGERLMFLRSAFDSASDSPYLRPARVLLALEAIDDVCRLRSEAKRKRESIGPLEQVFRARGFDYRPRESMTAKGKWSEDYRATWKGRSVTVEQHLALGTGSPENCLRIHFFIDDESDKFVIAHVGRHKTNTRS